MTTISDLIRHLSKAKEDFGDIEVRVEGHIPWVPSTVELPEAQEVVLAPRTMEGMTGVDPAGDMVEGEDTVLMLLPLDHPTLCLDEDDPNEPS
jgi:hypothetical protein